MPFKGFSFFSGAVEIFQKGFLQGFLAALDNNPILFFENPDGLESGGHRPHKFKAPSDTPMIFCLIFGSILEPFWMYSR